MFRRLLRYLYEQPEDRSFFDRRAFRFFIGATAVLAGGLLILELTRGPTSTAEATNPLDYVDFDADGSTRSMSCDGLLGVCLGAPEEEVVAAFGLTEVDGFPRRSGTHQLNCHRWDNVGDLQLVEACMDSGFVSSIRVELPWQQPVAIRVGSLMNLQLPASLPEAEVELSNAIGSDPYDTTSIPFEGSDIANAAWELPRNSSESETVILRLSSYSGFYTAADPCDGVSGFPIDEWRQITTEAVPTAISAEFAAPGFAAQHSCDAP